jgi:glycosyltransferase involved in cell wall biosynthesis
MSYADCGIFPSRAEGWNNEAIEMMAMDKPIIITNYSAHTQFCNKDNAYLVDIDTTVPANDGIWFNGSGNWASIEEKQIDQFIEHMRYVYKNNIRDNSYGLKTANNLSWHNTANIIYSNMIN